MARTISKWFLEFIPEEISNSELFRFKVATSKDQIVTVDVRADLDIDYDLIKEQLVEAPSVFIYWASIYSEVKMQCNALERSIKARRGKLLHELNTMASKSGARITDKQSQMMIEGDDVLNDMEERLLVMLKHVGKLSYVVQALEMKCDNLRSLAGFARADYGRANQ